MRFFSKLQSSKGFTLVELLVVIAIIGILAAGVLVAINPLEQIRKSQDQASLQIANQYMGAIQSYAAAKGGVFPWAVSGSCIVNATPGFIGSTTGANKSCVTDALILNGDLKPNVKGQTNLNTLSLSEQTGTALGQTGLGSNVNPVICFQPQSAQMKKDASTKYTNATGTDSSCVAGGATACYACAF